MDPDDQVCLCYRVSLRKIRGYLAREDPPVASLISECLDAGTGCGWCVPFLEHLHAEHKAGRTPEQAGMELLAVPFIPTHAEYIYLQGRQVLADQMEFLRAHFPRCSPLHERLVHQY